MKYRSDPVDEAKAIGAGGAVEMGLSNEHELYLDLLKRSLLNIPYLENEIRLRFLTRYINENHLRQEYRALPDGMLHAIEDVADARKDMAAHRLISEDGRRPRAFAHAMMGRRRLDNIQSSIETILADAIAGDFLEAGVWKGAGPHHDARGAEDARSR